MKITHVHVLWNLLMKSVQIRQHLKNKEACDFQILRKSCFRIYAYIQVFILKGMQCVIPKVLGIDRKFQLQKKKMF